MQHLGGLGSLREDASVPSGAVSGTPGHRAGSGAALAASASLVFWGWGGVRRRKEGRGGADSVGRSGHQPAGKLGDKECEREERAKFGVGSAAVVSESFPARTVGRFWLACCPKDAFYPPAVPGPAETAALAVFPRTGTVFPRTGTAPTGAEREGAAKAFPRRAAGCKGARRPMPGLPRLASLTARPSALPLPITPLLEYLPLSASTLSDQQQPAAFSPKLPLRPSTSLTA